MPATVRCPICGKEVAFDDPNMPFCSDRCRLLDLGNWASERYRVPASGRGDELEEEEAKEDKENENQKGHVQ